MHLWAHVHQFHIFLVFLLIVKLQALDKLDTSHWFTVSFLYQQAEPKPVTTLRWEPKGTQNWKTVSTPVKKHTSQTSIKELKTQRKITENVEQMAKKYHVLKKERLTRRLILKEQKETRGNESQEIGPINLQFFTTFQLKRRQIYIYLTSPGSTLLMCKAHMLLLVLSSL